MRNITLCADDFGQNAAISAGIVELVQLKRLSAVSCMTNNNFSKNQAFDLKSIRSQIEIGLHFNLTHGLLLTNYNQQQPFTLKSLLFQSLSKQLSSQAIYHELKAQLDTFVEYFDQLPDFIDGHQHIHQFPMIRDALIKVINELNPQKKIYTRLPVPSSNKNFFDFKKTIIFLTGSWELKQCLVTNNIIHNQSFSGIYNFKNAKNFRQYFLKFLTEVHDRGIIMCHPGNFSDDATDPLNSYRVYELNYLKSSQFMDDCIQHKIQLTPFLGGK